jgi:hypothetical protein
MKLVISIDVEEEGLFSGEYARTPPGVANVAALNRLKFIPRELGFPLTLLVSYQVARDPEACRILARWREAHSAEIGLHLHPWNTPPFADLPYPEPIPAELLPVALLRDKLARLAGQVHGALGVTPRSFRMGRFDWGPRLPPLLTEAGVRVDSSVVPLSTYSANPGDFLAPADPFFLSDMGSGPLLEVPLTMVPVLPGSSRAVYAISRRLPEPWGRRLRGRFRYLGAAGIHPTWFPPASMRLAAWLHQRRGGRVLNVFFHSSELQPGATRFFPTEESVGRWVGRFRSFLHWLARNRGVEGVTLSGLYEDYRSQG